MIVMNEHQRQGFYYGIKIHPAWEREQRVREFSFLQQTTEKSFTLVNEKQ